MTYDIEYFPTVEEASNGMCYIATFEEDNPHDGTSGTYDEAEYDSYEKKVLQKLPDGWTTETDEDGVYLVFCEERSQ
jgi:hypothetical protein